MKYRLFVEDIEPNHWVAWVLDLPGCFSAARTREEAVALAPMRISAYFTWLKTHGHKFQPPREGIQTEVVETFRSFVSNGMYVVNAFFKEDQRPLSPEEIELGLTIMDYTRLDLLEAVQNLSSERLYQPIPGEVHGSIAGLLEHVAWAEWWYLDRLDLAFDRTQMPEKPLEQLNKVRRYTREQLPKLAGYAQMHIRRGEQWSARKVLRRTLWHERDHTQHIEKLKTYT